MKPAKKTGRRYLAGSAITIEPPRKGRPPKNPEGPRTDAQRQRDSRAARQEDKPIEDNRRFKGLEGEELKIEKQLDSPLRGRFGTTGRGGRISRYHRQPPEVDKLEKRDANVMPHGDKNDATAKILDSQISRVERVKEFLRLAPMLQEFVLEVLKKKDPLEAKLFLDALRKKNPFAPPWWAK